MRRFWLRVNSFPVSSRLHVAPTCPLGGSEPHARCHWRFFLNRLCEIGLVWSVEIKYMPFQDMRRPKQQEFKFRVWGGQRVRSGRKPAGKKALVSHDCRSYFRSRSPVHVTLRVQRGIASLRTKPCLKVIKRCLAACHSDCFAVVHYSVQSNHLHLIVEAGSRQSRGSGMQVLGIRMAKRRNALMGRVGKFFADRYHARVLTTPSSVAL